MAAPKKKPKGKRGGRRPGSGAKPIELDPRDVARLQDLCRDGAPHIEIANWLRISPRTLERMLNDDQRLYTVKHPERKQVTERLTLREIVDRGYAHMRIGIRREQIKLLQAGSATMAVWLGKQYLGQSDRVRVEEPAVKPEDAAIEIEVSVEELLKRRDRDVADYGGKK
jgi:hypothetical protein